jgi:hypothetical protein
MRWLESAFPFAVVALGLGYLAWANGLRSPADPLATWVLLFMAAVVGLLTLYVVLDKRFRVKQEQERESLDTAPERFELDVPASPATPPARPAWWRDD